MGSPRLALVGAFVIGGLALFAVGLFMIGDRRSLFAGHFGVEADFGNVTGIDIGTAVRLSGVQAGEVTGIVVPAEPGQRFLVRMRVREDLRPLVRTDSVAGVLTDGLLGAVFIQIRGGTPAAPRVEDGARLAGVDPIQVADLVEEGRETFRTVTAEFLLLRRQLSDAVAGLDETVSLTTSLLEDVGNDVRQVTGSSARLVDDVHGLVTETRTMMTQVAAGEGTVGKLLTDDELYVRITGLARESEATMQAVRGTAAQVQEAVAAFSGPGSAAHRLLADAGDAVVHARSAMEDLADNTEALKRNWPFRGFFADRGFYNLDDLTLEEYRTLGRDDRYAPLRVWIAADRLFEPGPDGRPALQAGAGRRIETAMGDLLRYPRTSPIIVEGYATAGEPGQQLLAAHERAALVRDHLGRAFRRSAGATGAIPIGAAAAESPSGDGRWDGVALTLFADRDALERGAAPASAP